MTDKFEIFWPEWEKACDIYQISPENIVKEFTLKKPTDFSAPENDHYFYTDTDNRNQRIKDQVSFDHNKGDNLFPLCAEQVYKHRIGYKRTLQYVESTNNNDLSVLAVFAYALIVDASETGLFIQDEVLGFALDHQVRNILSDYLYENNIEVYWHIRSHTLPNLEVLNDINNPSTVREAFLYIFMTLAKWMSGTVISRLVFSDEYADDIKKDVLALHRKIRNEERARSRQYAIDEKKRKRKEQFLDEEHPKWRDYSALTAETLTTLVWSMPVTDVAKLYGVSDKAIEKKCKKYNIDKPGRGYWAKVQAGHLPQPDEISPKD